MFLSLQLSHVNKSNYGARNDESLTIFFYSWVANNHLSKLEDILANGSPEA